MKQKKSSFMFEANIFLFEEIIDNLISKQLIKSS